jgi:hypothetical protein
MLGESFYFHYRAGERFVDVEMKLKRECSELREKRNAPTRVFVAITVLGTL